MTKNIDIKDKETTQFFMRLLSMSTNKKIIRAGNYFDRETGIIGNICTDIQNFVYEHYDVAYADNRLTGENKKDFEKSLNEYKAKKGGIK